MRKLIFTCIFLFLCSAVNADILYLKSGEKVEGKIKSQSGGDVTIEVYGVEMTYWEEDILRIEGEGGSKTMANVEPAEEKERTGLQIEGSPEEVYMLYINALNSAENVEDLFENLKDYMPKDEYAETKAAMQEASPQERVQFFQMFKAMVPRDVEVVDTKIEGDVAVLSVTGTSFMGASEGTVTFEKKNGFWSMTEEKWNNPMQMQ